MIWLAEVRAAKRFGQSVEKGRLAATGARNIHPSKYMYTQLKFHQWNRTFAIATAERLICSLQTSVWKFFVKRTGIVFCGSVLCEP